MFSKLKIGVKNSTQKQEKVSHESYFCQERENSNFSRNFLDPNPEYYSFSNLKVSRILSSKRLDENEYTAEFLNGSNVTHGSEIIQLFLKEQGEENIEFASESRRKQQRIYKQGCRMFLTVIKLVKNNMQLIKNMLINRLQKEKQYFECTAQALFQKFQSMQNQLQFLKSNTIQKDKLIKNLRDQIRKLKMVLSAKQFDLQNSKQPLISNNPFIIFNKDQKKADLSDPQFFSIHKLDTIGDYTSIADNLTQNQGFVDQSKELKLMFKNKLKSEEFSPSRTIKVLKTHFIEQSKLSSEADLKKTLLRQPNINYSAQLTRTNQTASKKYIYQHTQIGNKSLKEKTETLRKERTIELKETRFNKIKQKIKDELSLIKDSLSCGLQAFK